MNAIESLVKTYVVIEIDSSNKDVEKNETHGDDLGTPKEHPKDFPEKNDDVNAVYTGDHKRDEKPSTESSHKFNFDDSAFRRQTIEVSCTVLSYEAFQELIDNIIVGMSIPIVAMAVNSDDLSQNANLPDLSLQTANVEVPNELRESTNAISTDSSQESIDNIRAGIFTPVVAMKMKSISPTEIKDNEYQIHDTRFQLVFSEEEAGKQDSIKTRSPRNRKQTTIFRSPFTTEFCSSCKDKESTTVDFPRMHLFNGYLISHEMLMGLSEEYCDWIVEGLLKFHEKKEPSHEIKKLSEMLPTYISYSGLLENTERTVWSSLESYKDKMSNVAGDLNDTPFDVEYVEDIAQQVSGSLDCGVFMAAYAEFLSDQMQIPSSNLDAEYLRNRYTSLLWNYGSKKAKKIYSSDHDDPP
ncbi:hypothetical protein FXO37_10349 [Capsicum annuum]|nr:hypothetical protein FXO37_10349 [Capsicum annuum]